MFGFGKSKLQKILEMLNDLTDEELNELISAADEMKDGGYDKEKVEEKTEEVEKTEEITEDGDEKVEEVEEQKEETEVEEEIPTEDDAPEAPEEAETEAETIAEAEEPEEVAEAEEAAEEHQEVDGEILSSIKAMKETIEALTARIEAMEKADKDERNDFEFGLAGNEGVTEEKKDSLKEIKEKYWNL